MSRVVVDFPQTRVVTQALRRRARGRMQLVPVVLFAPGHVAAQSRVGAAVVPVARVPPQLYPRGPRLLAHFAPMPLSIDGVFLREAHDALAVPGLRSLRVDARAGRVPHPRCPAPRGHRCAMARELCAARWNAQHVVRLVVPRKRYVSAARRNPQRWSAQQHPGQHVVSVCPR